MDLSRKDLILKYIVEYFIRTASPVGSHTLIEEYQLPYSSATIRNEMAELERNGMIEKTHTSSGRIPSTKGYKYYISYLRERDLDSEIKNQLALVLNEKSKSIEDVIKESCEVLSHMTNLASVVLGPNADEERLISVQCIPLAKNSATAVFVTDKGYVENKTFIFPSDVNIVDVQNCVKMLNDRLVGTSISALVPKMEVIKPIITQYVKDNDIIYRAFAEMLLKFTENRVSMFGTDNLFDQPEFSDNTSAIKKMMKLLESPEVMKNYHNKGTTSQVFIGDDNDNDDLKNVSVVTSNINVNGQKRGTIALVGPTRMDYDKVLSALEYVVGELNKFFNDEGKEDEDGRE